MLFWGFSLQKSAVWAISSIFCKNGWDHGNRWDFSSQPILILVFFANLSFFQNLSRFGWDSQNSCNKNLSRFNYYSHLFWIITNKRPRKQLNKPKHNASHLHISRTNCRCPPTIHLFTQKKPSVQNQDKKAYILLKVEICTFCQIPLIFNEKRGFM